MYEVGQGVAVAYPFLSLEDPGHDPRDGRLYSSPGGWLGPRLCW